MSFYRNIKLNERLLGSVLTPSALDSFRSASNTLEVTSMSYNSQGSPAPADRSQTLALLLHVLGQRHYKRSSCLLFDLVLYTSHIKAFLLKKYFCLRTKWLQILSCSLKKTHLESLCLKPRENILINQNYVYLSVFLLVFKLTLFWSILGCLKWKK